MPSYNRPSAPPWAAPLTSSIHHDIYPAISPIESLAGSATSTRMLITGAGRGIGRAAAIAFAQAGAAKVVLTSRNHVELNEVEEAIEAAVGKDKVQIVKAIGDVSILKDVQNIFDKAGTLDVLINNAGILEVATPIHESDPEAWWRTQEVNTKGTYLSTREFLRRHLGHRMTIVNTSSVGSMATVPGMSSYQSGKTMINRFTEYLHFEYQGQNVRTFAYHPGSVLTKLAREGLPPGSLSTIQDTPELAAGFLLWLVTQGNKVDFLRGRYLSANWDVNEILEKKEEIVKKGLLWTRVVGQEQGLELVKLPW